MVKNLPNQIVNLQNNFFLSRNLFFLFLKRFLPILALLFYCASLFAQVSSENNFVFSIKKVKLFSSDLRLSEQKLSTTLSNVKNVHNLPCKFQPFICLYSEVIKNHDEKPASLYLVFPVLKKISRATKNIWR
jgi:hypothetical protein